MKHRYKRRPAARAEALEPRDDRISGISTRWLLTALLALLPAASPLAADDEPPSAALLEFLGELEPVDDETWALIERHAQRDLAQEDEVQNE